MLLCRLPVLLHVHTCAGHASCRGAYRGAGSSHLRRLLRVDAAPPGEYDGAADNDEDMGDEDGVAAGGESDAGLAAAVQAIAEAAQLGLGSAAQLYPQSLEEYMAACEEDTPWRVAL